MKKGLRTFSGKKPFEIEEMCDGCAMHGSELCPDKLCKDLQEEPFVPSKRKSEEQLDQGFNSSD